MARKVDGPTFRVDGPSFRVCLLTDIQLKVDGLNGHCESGLESPVLNFFGPCPVVVLGYLL